MNEPLRVPDSDLDFDADQVVMYLDEPFTGVGFEYEEALDGGLSEISYAGGMQTGPARDWSPAGVLKAETYFREGVRHGREREFDDAGRLTVERHYEYGILLRTYDCTGDTPVLRSELQQTDPNIELLTKMRRDLDWPAPSDPDTEH